MSTPTTASRVPVRRRRLIIIVATLVSLLFIYSVLPPSLRDAGLDWSRANLYPTKADSEALKVDEIYGLLYMVTENEEHVLTDLPESDFSAPLNMTVYTGREEINWPKMVKRLDKNYSRRAKKLLESYRIRPAPKVIEVDLRRGSFHQSRTPSIF
ncbi:hypothetical protein H0H93_016213 [Arthromyces matolae]|nr:hypothetical protein H0H93_016213 [Arthromyces matolae]